MRGPFIVSNCQVVTEELVLNNGFVKVNKGTIIDFGSMSELTHQDKDEYELITFPSGYYIIPGMIDLHIHGLNGADVMDGTIEAYDVIATSLPCEGTTSFLATTATDSEAKIQKVLQNVPHYLRSVKQSGKAEMLGIHLEGPFISKEKVGAQPLEHVIEPDVSLFKKWNQISEEFIKVVTLAPELENGLALTKYLAEQEIIASIGHSNGSYEVLHEALLAGASQVTHLFNAMSGVHHREPGIAAGALLHKELIVEVIPDGIHVHPKMLELVYQIKGSDNILVITDSIRAKNLEPGTYDFVGQEIKVGKDRATLLDGTLAGSILTMEKALQNMHEFTNASIDDLVKMTSTNAAKRLKLEHRKGSITKGKDADLVILNEKLEVVMTICRGEIAFKKFT
ncbi:N-acetylglucosamine-6-phosphate deacetylase [Bacillus sp. AK128]